MEEGGCKVCEGEGRGAEVCEGDGGGEGGEDVRGRVGYRV